VESAESESVISIESMSVLFYQFKISLNNVLAGVFLFLTSQKEKKNQQAHAQNNS